MRKLLIGCLGVATACAPKVDLGEDWERSKVYDELFHQEAPDQPEVSAPPRVVSQRWLPVYGYAATKRLLVRGLAAPRVYTLPPDGSFCLELDLEAPGTYDLEFVAFREDGELSLPMGPFSVEYNPTARSDGMVMCDGRQVDDCAPGATEICGDRIDNNCDGWVDEADPRCRSCQDDAFEPNNDLGAPMVNQTELMDLMMCPEDRDVFGIRLEAGQRLEVYLDFPGYMDLDLAMYRKGQSAPARTARTDTPGEYLSFQTTTSSATVMVEVTGGAPHMEGHYNLRWRIVDRP